MAATTIMLRCVPKRYTAWDLVSELERFAVRMLFDFVYVPWDKNSVTNMSYAFVNFCDRSVASCVAERMSGVPWLGSRSGQVIQTKVAHVQGLALNLQRFRAQVASKGGVVAAHAPLVFERGVYVPWDAALAGHCAEPPALCKDGGDSEEQPAGGDEEEEASQWTPVPTQASTSAGRSTADSEEGGDNELTVAGDPAADPAGRPQLTAAQLDGLAASRRQVKDLLMRLMVDRPCAAAI